MPTSTIENNSNMESLLLKIRLFASESSLLAKYGTLATVFGVTLCIYGLALVIYRLYFDSLAKFPGPRIAAATGWYEFYYDVIRRGQYIYKIEEMHKKYGTVKLLSSPFPLSYSRMAIYMHRRIRIPLNQSQI